jgi:hypothetical protein
MNMTDVMDNMDGLHRWAAYSPAFTLTSSSIPTLYTAVAVGFGCFLHSTYIHYGKPYKVVRVISDVNAIAVALEAICFLQCLDGQCSTLKQTVVYNLIATVIFALISQTCDNYLTYQRYKVMCGGKGLSACFRYSVFGWYVTFLLMTWMPFYTILPIWYDQSSDEWLYIEYIFVSWMYFVTYFVYNLFFLVSVCRAIYGIRQSPTITEDSKMKFTGVAVRAICHSFSSFVGMFFFSFYLPDGVYLQTVCLALGIHFSLNVKDYGGMFTKAKARVKGAYSSGKASSSQIHHKASTSKVHPHMTPSIE